MKGKGAGLGHSLTLDPEAVYWVVQLGARTFCGEFGGTTRYKADKSYSARLAPAPLEMPDF